METWFLEFDFFDQYYISGFDLLCNSRVGKCGGGVCIYVSTIYETVEPARLAGREALVAVLYFLASRMFFFLCLYCADSQVSCLCSWGTLLGFESHFLPAH